MTRKNQTAYRERLRAKGFKETTIWLRPETLDLIHNLSKSRKESNQYERLQGVIADALAALDRVTRDTAKITRDNAKVTRDSTAKVTRDIPADAVPSRQAAAMLGYKSSSALDNAVRRAGFAVGLVKSGMPGSGRRAVFVGKAASTQGGPDRSLWRVEDDTD